MMVGQLSPLNPEYQQRLATAQNLFATRFSAPDALDRAHALTYSTLIQQADYWSYMSVFYLIAWLCALCVLGSFLFGKPKVFHAAAAGE